ncbi:MAG: beta-propeller fold lactonase family protein [Terracidiphilus sp.]
MKLNKSSQLLLVSAVSLLGAGLVSACGTLTTDFVYVTSAKAAGTNNYGEIDVFEINAVSGFMRQIPTSPFPSGGRNPVAEAVSTDYNNLYVVNHDDNTIVQFSIGPDGKLYAQYTVNTPGIFPMAVAVNGSNLFVLDTYQPLANCSNAEPCSGAVGVFPILAASGTGSNATPGGGLGDPVTNPATGANYWPLSLPGSPNDVIVPTGIDVVESGALAYVSAYDSTSSTGYVFGFSVASGALTPLKAGAPLAAITHPSAITSDSSSGYVYVTDSTVNKLFSYAVKSDGSLSQLAGSPIATGNQPSAIVADSKYPYLYVTNALDGTVSGYSIGSSGVLSSFGTYPTGIQPVAIGIDPSTDHFLFTVNFLANGASGTISDFEIDPTAGALVNAQRSPYTTAALPTAVAAVPHKTTQ